MMSRPITLMAAKRGATVPRIAKLGHRACDEDDEGVWYELLTAIGYAESYGALHPDDVIDDEEPERAPIGFTY